MADAIVTGKMCKKCLALFTSGKCSACVKARSAKRYIAKSGHIKALSAAWKAANPEKVQAYKLAWYAANTEKNKATHAAWLSKNKDKARIAATARQKANRAKVRLASNKVVRIAKTKEQNRECERIKKQNREARKRKNGGRLSHGLVEKLFKLQRGKCACCGLSLGEKYHLDHIMPLALGGLHVDSNIQLLRSICNLQKSAKHPVEFMQQRGFLL